MSLCGDYSAKLVFSETSKIVDRYDVIGDIVIERNKGPFSVDRFVMWWLMSLHACCSFFPTSLSTAACRLEIMAVE
jgi:hypothetical protein